MKKLKIIIFTFLSWILIGISLPKPVYCTENINSISLFSGDASASVSNVAATIINPKNFRCIDTDVMNKDGYFYAKYTGDKEAIRLVFESSYGGEEWVTITPSETGNTEDGCYYAKFNDETLKSYYKSDYANIDKIHIWAVNGKIALKSLQYVVQGREDNQLIENTYLPTETNVKSLGRTYFYNNALWCALSGSGAEYTFNGTKCEVTILGDNVSQWGG